MKIALIAPTQIPARRANTVQVMKMAQALAQIGQTVRLYSPWLDGAANPTWDELAHHYGLRTAFEVIWIPARAKLRGYDYGWEAVSRARRWRADLIFTRLPQAAALSSLLGQPTLLEVHDLPAGRGGRRLFQAFLKGRGRRRMIVITQALAQDLHQKLGAPLASPFTLIAPDGVDLDRYADLLPPQQARLALGRPAQQFTAGYSGHLYPGRGTELLVELAAALPQVAFLWVGGEPEAVTRLQAEINARRLPNVTLTGFIPNAELPRYQAACDVLLMPYQDQVSASSGGDIGRYLSPMKLFEYLACGRAILSSDLPPLREILNASNALLLPAREPAAWAAALSQLQADPQRCQRLGEQARRDASRYTWQTRARRILEGLPEGTA